MKRRQDITKNQQTKPEVADEDLARQMKEGLAPFKKQFARRLAGVSAVCVLGILGLGYVLGWSDEVQPVQDWTGEIASSLRETETRFDSWEAQPAFANYNKWLGRDFNVEFAEPDLTFETAALRDVAGRMLLHWRFRTGEAIALDLFMVQTMRPDLSEPVVAQRYGFQTASWTKGGVEYFITSEADFDSVWSVAKHLSGR